LRESRRSSIIVSRSRTFLTSLLGQGKPTIPYTTL
jgi:hypothetical protein